MAIAQKHYAQMNETCGVQQTRARGGRRACDVVTGDTKGESWLHTKKSRQNQYTKMKNRSECMAIAAKHYTRMNETCGVQQTRARGGRRACDLIT